MILIPNVINTKGGGGDMTGVHQDREGRGGGGGGGGEGRVIRDKIEIKSFDLKKGWRKGIGDISHPFRIYDPQNTRFNCLLCDGRMCT